MEKNVIESLSKIIAKLPGLGPRAAKRIILNLANNKEKTLLPLIKAMQSLHDNIHNCEICDNLDEGLICSICSNQTRDKSIICIVEEVADLWAIERAGNYKGTYHILGGNLSAISGKSIEDLNIKKLYERL
ncbi:MAG: recombination protein RecR, partial [Pelagibacterales bacterium]|nr:recombination protein RecR [Pelagibacterales bacterium]